MCWDMGLSEIAYTTAEWQFYRQFARKITITHGILGVPDFPTNLHG